jgi:hypothetical protein
MSSPRAMAGVADALDDGDHLVHVGKRHREALQHVPTLARLAQVEDRAARDDLAAGGEGTRRGTA